MTTTTSSDPAANPIQSGTGTVEVDGGTLFYEIAGPADGEPIVFIHGGLGDHRMWDAQFTRFAADHRVVRYDHRGYGRSSFPTARYSPVDDLRRLLDALDLPRVHLVGNSMGGGVALDFTLVHPDRVITLASVASGANGYPMDPAEQARYQPDVDAIESVFAAARAAGHERGVELWSSHAMVKVAHADPELGPRVRRMIAESTRLFEIEFWPDEGLDPPAAARLAEVTCPVLVVYGDQDSELAQASARYVAAGIAGARLEVLPGADHLPQMEKVRELDALLAALIGGGGGGGVRGTGAASR